MRGEGCLKLNIIWIIKNDRGNGRHTQSATLSDRCTGRREVGGDGGGGLTAVNQTARWDNSGSL